MLKRAPTLFLKAVIILVAIAAFVFLLWFPQVEGRNAHSDPISLYLNDPFLAYVYISSIAFFAALYQGFAVLGYIEQGRIFSQTSLHALRTLQCSLAVFIGFVAAAIPFVLIMGKIYHDDSAGAVAMGLAVIFASAVVAVASGVFRKIIQSRM